MCVLAAGAVIYRVDRNEPFFLLLENSLHGTWCFPKGHLGPGEDLETCAVRECGEETGMEALAFFPDFLKTTEHSYPEPKSMKTVRKRTSYFLASSGEKSVRLSSEHSSFVWKTRLDARKTLQFDTLREVLDCAYTAAGIGLSHGDVSVARSLLEECSQPGEPWDKHCIKVAKTALVIATSLLRVDPHLPIDTETVEAGALLHDIGRCRAQGVEHPRCGMELLFERGLDHLAKPCISHWLKGKSRKELEKEPYFNSSRLDALFHAFDLNTMTLSEKIISTADSLVRHDMLVGLKERYRDARERYGDSQWLRDNERISAGFIDEIEGILGYSLDDLLGLH